MEKKIFKLNEKENTISFNVDKDHNMMVNATEMANIFGKLVKDFMDNDGTQKFIQACLRKAKSEREKEENNNVNSDLNKVISPFLNIKSEEDLYTSKQKTGTWMHQILAIKFAAWLDPDFEVWV